MREQVSQQKAKLTAEDLSLSFGGVRALDGVSFDVYENEILAVIGPNGAGKTCCINCITGFYRPERGSIYWDGHDLTRTPCHKIVGLGVARTFQNITLYTGLSTLDNLMAARHHLMRQSLAAGALYFGWAHREELNHRARVEEIIDFLEMEEIRKKTVGTLPYGMRKRIDLGRALATEPKLLLLDEPTAGMNADEKEDIVRFILDIRETSHIPVVIVEHDMEVVMDITNRIIVLDFGHKIAEGSPSEIRTNADVIKAYLGEE